MQIKINNLEEKVLRTSAKFSLRKYRLITNSITHFFVDLFSGNFKSKAYERKMRMHGLEYASKQMELINEYLHNQLASDCQQKSALLKEAKSYGEKVLAESGRVE